MASVANVGTFTVIYIFIARVSSDPYTVGAIGLGNMTLNLILRSYVLGFNNSLVTSLSQAYGAKLYDKMGDIINRAKLLFLLLMLPIFAVLFFTKPILIMFGQPEELSERTQTYVRFSMFGFIGQLYFDIYRKLLNSMRLFHIHSFIPYVSLVLHSLWCFLFIYYLELDVIGAGLTVAIQCFTNFITIYIIVHLFGYGKEPIKQFTITSFEGWKEMFVLGVPTYFIQLFTFLSIEIVILITGYVDVKILVANTALVNILYMFYLYIYALIQSWASMIGNKIGEGWKESAIKLINAVMIFGFSFTAFSALLIFLFEDYIFIIYVSDEDVLEIMKIISNIFVFTLISYNLKDLFWWILFGLGLQSKTITFNICSYVFCGVPISLLWTFVFEWIYIGPWVGITISLAMNAGYYYYLYKSHDIQYFIDQYKIKHLKNIT